MAFRVIIVIVILKLVSIHVCDGQHIWPFRDENGNVVRGNITGTVGDYRASGTSTRFHAGVDFTSSLTDLPGRERSKAVYSMHAGTIFIQNQDGCLNDYIRILTTEGNYVYYKHINVTNFNPVTNQAVVPLANGNTVQIGAFLGIMVTDGGCDQHVHINDNTSGISSLAGTTNFINNFVNPFDDNQEPDFMYPFNANGNIVTETNTNSIIEFRSNGHTYSNHTSLYSDERIINNLAHRLVFEKVDILSRLRDRKILSNGLISNEGNNGINSVYYEILDSKNIAIGSRVSNINFNTVPPLDRAPYVFDSRSVIGTVSRHIYILTNSPINSPYDRFWNTRLRLGQNEDWDIINRGNKDARSISEAFYPDGQYKIRIVATDIRSADGSSSNFNPKIASLLIDNFRPYIKEVIVRKNGSEGRLVSRGFWEWNSASGQLALKHDQGDDAGATDAIWIKIVTSEPVQNVRLNVASVHGSNFFEVNQVVPNSDNKEFIAVLNPIATSGDQIIRIQAEDYAGNQLQIDPSLIPIRQPDGTWSAGVQPGDDANHYFKTGTFVCTNGGNPGGRTASNSSTSPCLYSDFSISQSTVLVNEAVKFSPIASGSGVLTYNWNFGSGAIPATSNSSGLQTVTYTTTGTKSVTLQICDVTTNCIIAEKVNAVTVQANGSSEITVDFSANPTVATVGQNIQLTATVSGASGPVSYWWHFDTGLKQGVPTDANPVISYTTPGNKSISLTVTDSYGNATKVRNSFLLITSNVYNVEPKIQGGCITVGADGLATFSAFVTGGNGPPYDSYLWDFGDGETSTLQSPPAHKYTRTGKYTVRLTVCDETSCGTTEVANCVSVPWITDTNSLKPDFMVNNIPFPAVYSPIEVGLNTPVTFTDNTVGGGSQIFLTYNWDFESHFLPGWGQGNTIESATPNTATGVGPHEVYYTVAGNKESRIVVGTTGPGSFVRDKIRPTVKVVKGLGSGRCYANIGEVKVSSTCWSPTAIPTFTVPVLKSNCPIAKTEVLYWPTSGSAVVLPGNKLDFAAMGVPVPQFPLTTDFSFAVYQFDGISYNRIGYKRQRFTIYGPVQVDAGQDKNICVGSSITLGSAAPDNHSFLWSTGNANDLNFLNSKTSPNPVFTGTQKGTFNYTLKVTNTLTGCVSVADDVMISVNEPKVNSISYSPRPTESILLSPVISDGFGGNNFTWTPAINLNNSQSVTPTFSSAVEGNYSYNVTVKDLNGCTGSGQVFVNVSDAAGDVTGTPASYSRIIVSWKDRSNNETGYLIRKSIGNNSSYFDLVTVEPNITSYEDTNVLKDVKYYYHVITLFGTTSKSSLEFSVNTNTLPAFTFKPTSYDMFGRAGDFDNDLDLDFVVGTSHVVWNSNGNFSSNSLTTGSGFFDAVADFDSDDDLDIFNGQVLKNNNGSFSQVIWSSDLKNDRPIVVDINGDNHVDIIDNRKIRLNVLGNSFNTIESTLPITHGQYGPGQTYALGDMDNDGDQDIVSQSELNLIVTSNSAGVFLSSTIIESNAFTTGLYMGQFEIGDLNNDGLLDIACAAIYKNLTIYLNKGNSSFSTIILPNTKINDRGLLKLGDMDNDGDLDIFITGNPLLWDNTKKYNAVFENNNGTFTQIKLPIGEPMLIDWVDFDNDGDLDIIASGYNVDGIYINNLNSNKYKTNTKPTAPQILCSTLAGNKLTMSWNRASDGETPAPGLTYNVYVKQNGAWVMTPLSNPINGFRKVAQRGNVDHNLSWTITLPNTGNIEWGVQTVDAQYVGSTFTTASLQYSSIANTSKSICSGEKSNIGLSSPAANPTFSWIVKEASPNITGSSAGSGNILDQTLTNSSNTTTGVVTYEITESFPSCLKKKYEVRVTVNPRPSSVVSLNGSSIICQGESVRLTAPTGVNYLWTNGSTNSYIDVTIAGTYSVLVTNQFGCNQRSSNVQITVNPRPKIFITPASPVLICQGSSVTLTASPQYVSQGSSLVLANIFTWSSGVISNSITVSNPGIYTVSTYNIQNNCTISNTIEVLHYTPVINIIRSGDVCLNGSAVLSYSGPAYTSLLWSTGATSNSITVYGPGSYSVTANFAGCSVPITDYEVINPCNIDPCLNKVKNRIDPCAIARKAADVVNKTETNELWLVDEPTIFPNPASTKVVIAIPYVTEKDIPINVYNVTGLKVLSSNLNSGRYYCEISIPDVPDGLYLVQIGVGEKEIRQKLEILKK